METNDGKFFKKLSAVGVLTTIAFLVAGLTNSNVIKVPVGLVCVVWIVLLVVSIFHDVFKEQEMEDLSTPTSQMKEPVISVPNRSPVVL